MWLTYKTCAKIVKQFRKYMWSKCDLRTNEAQGNGAKVRRRNRGGIGQAASSQFCALSNENVARKFWANQQVHTCKTKAVAKQFRKYMWSKGNFWTNEAQGNGAKVRRRNRGGMERAAPSQFSALSNCFLRCPMKMWRENFEPINKCTRAGPKQSRNDLQISIKTLDLTYFLKIPHGLICRALVHKLAIGQQR